MSDADRIEALERAFVQMAEQLAAVAAATAAQGVITRAVVEILSRGAGSSASDVHDLALVMAEHIGGPISTAVRVLLAEGPASSAVRH